MRMVTDGLVAILDDAVEDGHVDSNPARGRRMRIKVPKPRRTFLELDELAALIDAASEQDISLGSGLAPIEFGLTAAQVAQLHGQGKTPTQIARQLALAKSTVSHHLKRLGLTVGRGYVGRRVVVEILGRGGPRASELCDLKIGHVRLHDPGGARFRIPDAKTETGIREVQMTPDLVETVVEHLDRLSRAQATLADLDAPIATDVLAGIERTDDRERSSIFSATAGVLAAYNSDAVRQAAANPNFDPNQFATSTETIYITAPGHKQALCAPPSSGYSSRSATPPTTTTATTRPPGRRCCGRSMRSPTPPPSTTSPPSSPKPPANTSKS
jgi:DNA-binding transcriptional ArsR family regulator